MFDADRTGLNIFMNDVLEPFASEMLVNGFVCAVDTGMVEVCMIPSDDGMNQTRRDVNFFFVKDKLVIVDKFNFK